MSNKKMGLKRFLAILLSVLLFALCIPFNAVALDSVSYVAVNGSTESVSDYTVITSSTTTMTTGWYVLKDNVTISTRITVSGTVHLLLCDGATLTAPKGISLVTGNILYIFGQSGQTGEIDITGPEATYAGIGGGRSASDTRTIGTLYINGGTINVIGGVQAAGIGSGITSYGGYITINRGTVIARSNTGGGAAIGGGMQSSSGTITINGGTVSAVADSVVDNYTGAGIGGGCTNQCNDITINGGTVHAVGGYHAAGIGAGSSGSCVGTITINGGTVDATGGEGAAAIGGCYGGGFNTINITGGSVEAYKYNSSTADGNGIGWGASTPSSNTNNCIINLGWTNSTDKIFATNYKAKEINIDNMLVLDGTTTPATPDNIDNEWIAPYTGSVYDVRFFDDDGVTEIGTAMQIIPGNPVSKPADPVKFGCRFVEWQLGGTSYDFSTPVNTDINLQAVWTYLTAVPYVDEYGAPHSCQDYDMIETTSSPSDYTLDSGWYVVSADASIPGRMEASGDVKIILCDGATLNIAMGMSVLNGNSLTIYAQQGGTGAFKANLPNTSNCQDLTGIGATANKAAGNITINGGVITVSGGSRAAGIGGSYYASNGTVTINAGTVNATGGIFAAGIGGGNFSSGAGTVVINGGEVVAKGGSSAAGIGMGSQGGSATGTVTINGGTVSAKSINTYAADIGGGYATCGGTLTITGGNVSTDGTNSYTGFGAGSGAAGTDTGTINLGLGSSSDSIYISSSNASTVNFTSSLYKTDLLDPVDSSNYTGDTLRTMPSVTYITDSGSTAVCSDFTLIEDSTGTDDVTFSDSGWYVVSGDVTINGRIIAAERMSIILMDGATLNAPKGITVSGRLTIFAQQEGTGALNITAPKVFYAGIGGYTRNVSSQWRPTNMSEYIIIINGGNIYAQGGDGAAGIGNAFKGTNFGTVRINGGTVTAIGGDYFNLNVSGSNTIYSACGIGGDCVNCIDGSVIISGGQVTATGGVTKNNKATLATAAGIGGIYRTTPNIGLSLSWKNETDFVESSGYAVNEHLSASGVFEKVFYVDGTDTVATITNAKGNKIVPYWTCDYCEADGTLKTATGIQRITDSTDAVTLTEGWVLVKEDATVSQRISTTENITLLLKDGATLTASKGIGVTTSNSSLTVYAQELGTGAIVTGTPDNNNAGIGGDNLTYAGSIIINGGNITAQGAAYSAGIGAASSNTCKEIIINAGTVNATGGRGAAGIGGGYMSTSTGPIYINGGNITAHGGRNATVTSWYITGIGAGTAKPGSTGTYIGNIYLNWTNETDSITTNGYNGNITFVSPFILDAPGDNVIATSQNAGDKDTTVTIIPCPFGDIDSDNDFDLDDYAIVKAYLGGGSLTDYQMVASDMNRDTAVDAFDAYYLDRIARATV